MSVKMPEPDAPVLARRDQIVRALRRIVPGEGVIASEVAMRPYESDGLTAYRQLPMVVVLPETTRQVSRVLRYCHDHGQLAIGGESIGLVRAHRKLAGDHPLPRHDAPERPHDLVAPRKHRRIRLGHLHRHSWDSQSNSVVIAAKFRRDTMKAGDAARGVLR